MKKNILWKVNIAVCLVIIVGFIATSVIGYGFSQRVYCRSAQSISELTSEGIYNQIDAIFTKPVNVSLTMANDRLLIDFLKNEEARSEEEEFLHTMQNYLTAYKNKYNYDSVFLVSTKTNRYYHFNGIDRTLTPDNPENTWYYSFLESDEEHALNIDNDEVAEAENEVTVFVNCKIRDENRNTLGVVGVGFRVNQLQSLLNEYQERFHVQAYLVQGDGTIEISATQSGYDQVDLFEQCPYPQMKEQILSNKDKPETLWYHSEAGMGYLISSYIPELEWHLIIENDAAMFEEAMNRQFLSETMIVICVIIIILLMTTRIIKKYNLQIIKLALAREKERSNVFHAATMKLYDKIYELDITHNCAANQETAEYFAGLGAPVGTPYNKALPMIAQKQIKEEYRQGYLDTFMPEKVLKAYAEGKERLDYELQISTDGVHYYWTHITGLLVYLEEENSIHMITYRENIDSEKRQEERMRQRVQRDYLSGLYNKIATQGHIRKLLCEGEDSMYAFFMMDIDNFKYVNDSCGHAIGDLVIADFAEIIKKQFREDDIVGRVGGDEFAVFVPAPSKEWVEKKAGELVQALCHTFTEGAHSCQVSASIGVAVFPEAGTTFESLYKCADEALYHTKKNGKNGYTIYQKA